MTRIALFFVHVLLLALGGSGSALKATDYYVSPQGTPGGSGSSTQPLDIATALSAQSPAGPGDTIFLQAGTYVLPTPSLLQTNVSGAPGSYVTVRPAPGAQVTIDGGFDIRGGWVIFRDLTVLSSSQVRQTSQPGSWPTDIVHFAGFSVLAPNVKIVNNIVHDIGLGISSWSAAPDSEIYGNIVYYIGWQGPDRSHGHGFYGQNQMGAKVVEDNIFHNAFSLGLKVWGSSSAYLNNFRLEGNMMFNNGSLSTKGEYTRNLLAGGGSVLKSAVIRDNYSYFPLRPNLVGQHNIGYWPVGAGCTDLTFENNYFATGGAALELQQCLFSSMQGNTLIGGLVGFQPIDFPQNVYVPVTVRPSGVEVFVRPNKYEVGRAHIAIFNWDLLDQVTVDLSDAGLEPGDPYELRNIQNFEFDVRSGTYAGQPIQISMTNQTVAVPHGWNAPPSTFPEFGVFLLRKTETVPSSDEISPEVSVLQPQSAQVVSGDVQLVAVASDNVGVVGVQFQVDGAPVGPELTGTPYQYGLDTTAYPDGVHQITAVARDAANNTTVSTAVGVTINNADTTSPTVSVTAPASGQEISGVFTLQANAADNVGVVGVQFQVDGAPVGPELTSAPYQYGLDTTAFSNGVHQITAVARDAANNTTVSTAVGVTINNGPPPDTTFPTVSITAPASGQEISGVFALQANAADNVGVVGVQFQVDGAPVGPELTAPPFTYGLDTTAFGDSVHQITAAARDAANNTTVSTAVAATINNAPPPPPPLVPESLLFEGESFQRNGFGVGSDSDARNRHYIFAQQAETGTATRANFSIAVDGDYVIWCRVRIPDPNAASIYVWMDGQEDIYDMAHGTWSNQWQWSRVNARAGAAPLTQNPRLFPLSRAQHTLRLRARDVGTTIDAVLITNVLNFVPTDEQVFPPDNADEDTTPPTVSVTAPTSGQEISGTFTLQANAADNVGVVGVQFHVDGAPVGPELTTPPFNYGLVTTAFGDGAHQITAAARDAENNTTVSTAVAATINNVDTTPPTVAVTAPTSGQEISDTFTLQANAADNVGVVGVQFHVDGAPVGPELTAPPFNYGLDTTAFGNGAHQITAVARDAENNSTVSTAVSATINNLDTIAPTVSVTAPTSGQEISGTFTLQANAADNVGVVGVQFHVDGAPVGPELTAPPYNYGLDTTAFGDGVHQITAAARDAANNTTVSTAVGATINNAPPPPPVVPHSLLFEGESFQRSGFGIGSDNDARNRRYIVAEQAETGTATRANFSISVAGDYVVWCRVRIPDPNAASIYVSMDGQEDTYDMAHGTWSNQWQWSRVNARAGGAPLTQNPRLFALTRSQHTLVFRARDIGTTIDAVLITNVLNFMPTDQQVFP